MCASIVPDGATQVWKFVQLAIILPIVWSNLLWSWTENGYLPVLIGIMLAYVVSEICFDLRMWWASPRKR